ncbi:hypothetical protein BH11MYX1_BH11MYX1_54110 [soil metagenome]
MQKTYSIPERELTAIEHLGMSFRDARAVPDGHLSSWIERGRELRDGTTWVTLQERGQGWAIAIALDANGDVLAVVALSSEVARALD